VHCVRFKQFEAATHIIVAIVVSVHHNCRVFKCLGAIQNPSAPNYSSTRMRPAYVQLEPLLYHSPWPVPLSVHCPTFTSRGLPWLPKSLSKSSTSGNPDSLPYTPLVKVDQTGFSGFRMNVAPAKCGLDPGFSIENCFSERLRLRLGVTRDRQGRYFAEMARWTCIGACALLLAIPTNGFSLSPTMPRANRLQISSLRCQSERPDATGAEIHKLGRRALLAGILAAGAPSAMALELFGAEGPQVGWGDTSKG
jgi:hypothetical protein